MQERSELVVEIENHSRARGEQIGELRRSRANIVRVLKHRIGADVPASLVSQLDRIAEQPRLDALLGIALDTPSLAAFQQALDK